MVRNLEERPVNAEKQILAQALKAFEETTATSATVLKTEVPLPHGIADAEIRLGDGKRLLVEVKGNVAAATLGQAVAQLARFEKPGILVTRYVTPQMAEHLKELDVPFLDTAGNAYIRTPKLLIFVTGRKPRQPGKAEKPVRAFRTTGLKVVFACLCRPHLVAAPYREIAAVTGVALGTVGWVLKDLEKLGYLRITKAHGRNLWNKRELLDAWAAAYPRELRPKLHPRRFHAPDPTWWQGVDWRAFDAWLGGEPAAAEITGYLKPQTITVYGGRKLNGLFIAKRLRKDTAGAIEVMDAFWRFDYTWPHANLAPPLLIYAELIATAEARNLETARKLYEQYLV